MANLSQEEIHKLFQFYQVLTLEELVQMQAEQIQRLQKLLAEKRPYEQPLSYGSPRVG